MYEAVRDLTGETREDLLIEAQGEVETWWGWTQLAWGYTRK